MQALRIDVLIAEKAMKSGIGKREVNKRLAGVLGVDVAKLQRIKKMQGFQTIKPERLVIMAEYFDSTIDGLMNPELFKSVSK